MSTKKRDVEAIAKRIQELQKKMKEYEREYYVSLGRIVHEWKYTGKTEDIQRLMEKISEVKKQYGK